MAYTLMNRFMDLHGQVEGMNVHLERRVQKRTAVLSRTLDEVRQLKRKQDGDYFLTSLLIDPLSGNSVESETIEVRELSSQFKKFDFKEKRYEIGGDLCVSRSLKLNSRTYTVVMNADAMGKSLQGAGGVLVLGAVFRSYMERTEMNFGERDISPEEWLNEIYLELQSVFESFEGSMLVSAVLGLVDDASGLFYYFNAEHPWPVLYRKGKASYLKSGIGLRKIGNPYFGETIQICIFEMMPGDIIILGTDGRDDWLKDNAEDGLSMVNEDSQEFLNCVEEGAGEIEGILSAVWKRGIQNDDTSLLSLGFSGELRERQTERVQELLRHWQEPGDKSALINEMEKELKFEPRQPEALMKLIGHNLEETDYSRAADLIGVFIQYFPEDSEMLYLNADVLERLGEYKKAEVMGRRLLLREPAHIKGMNLLAKVYIKSYQPQLGKNILNTVLALEPENLPAQGLLREIESASGEA